MAVVVVCHGSTGGSVGGDTSGVIAVGRSW